MKLYKFLFAALIVFVCSMTIKAQTDPYSASGLYDQYMEYGESRSYVFYDGTLAALDTLGDGDSTWTYTVYMKSLFGHRPSLYFDLDSIGGVVDTFHIDLQSKAFPGGSWVTRERATWTTGVDTTGTLKSDSTHYDEFWRSYIHGTNDSLSILIDLVIIKDWEDR